MKPKDRVVQATDKIAEALVVLARVDYDNAEQANRNIAAAATRLRGAVAMLDGNKEQTK